MRMEIQHLSSHTMRRLMRVSDVHKLRKISSAKQSPPVTELVDGSDLEGVENEVKDTKVKEKVVEAKDVLENRTEVAGNRK